MLDPADLDVAVEYDEELLEEREVSQVGRVELVRRGPGSYRTAPTYMYNINVIKRRNKRRRINHALRTKYFLIEEQVQAVHRSDLIFIY